jgi:Putative zinc-finger
MTPPPVPASADCTQPIDPAALMDYWLGVLPSSEEEPIEEHLMGCDRCGDRLREAIALAESLRTLARSGALVVVISAQLVTRAEEMGQRVRQYASSPGESVQCTVSADDDLLVARLAADLSGAARVDLSWCTDQGIEIQRMSDIPIRGDAGTVLCQQSIVMAKASPSNTLIARLVSVDSGGGERLLGEYAFHHTRTIPGPGDWKL